MNPEEFTMWLKGFLAGTKNKIGIEEVQQINKTLEEVTKSPESKCCSYHYPYYPYTITYPSSDTIIDTTPKITWDGGKTCAGFGGAFTS